MEEYRWTSKKSKVGPPLSRAGDPGAQISSELCIHCLIMFSFVSSSHPDRFSSDISS